VGFNDFWFYTSEEYPLVEDVLPDQILDFSVDLYGLEKGGKFKCNWYLRDHRGYKYGPGESADRPFRAKIEVGEITQPQ
jgi:hypothetical protein